MTVRELIVSTRIDLQRQDNAGVLPLSIFNEAVDFLFELLWKRQSHLVRSGYELNFVADENSATFESGFRGLRESPYSISVTGRVLKVLLPLYALGRADLAGKTCSSPDYFELEGNDTLLLFPTPTEALTVKGDAYFHPGTLSMSDTVPFNGYFDRALKQVIIQSKTMGPQYTDSPAFMGFLEVAVNDVASIIKRTRGLRRRIRDF